MGEIISNKEKVSEKKKSANICSSTVSPDNNFTLTSCKKT